MNKNDIVSAFEPMFRVYQEHTTKELYDHLDVAMERYRKAVWVRDEWCCGEMVQFATHFWNAPRPKRDDEWFHTTFSVRGMIVNYCPFCGVYVGKPQEHKET